VGLMLAQTPPIFAVLLCSKGKEKKEWSRWDIENRGGEEIVMALHQMKMLNYITAPDGALYSDLSLAMQGDCSVFKGQTMSSSMDSILCELSPLCSFSLFTAYWCDFPECCNPCSILPLDEIYGCCQYVDLGLATSSSCDVCGCRWFWLPVEGVVTS
jgi:hypothetical protein